MKNDWHVDAEDLIIGGNGNEIVACFGNKILRIDVLDELMREEEVANTITNMDQSG